MPVPAEGPQDVASFLGRHPPFDGLDVGELRSVATSVVAHAYAAGETVLVEDGTPAEAFFVVRSGSMELVHEDEMIDIL